METGSESAHKLLELLITKALVSGKGKKATVRIPYTDLKPDIGPHEVVLADLVVTVSVSWSDLEDQ